MLKIAIVDDELSCLSTTINLVEKYLSNSKINFKIYKYNNKNIINDHTKENFDLIILDIIMIEYTGLDIANIIRKTDPFVKIAFYTSSKDYALESYNIDVNYYLLKGNIKHLHELLDKILIEYSKKESEFILLDTSEGIAKIEVNSIICIEHLYHVIIITLTNNRKIKTKNASISLKELLKLLEPYEMFIQPHRAYIVNAKFIVNIDNKNMEIINNIIIPIPRRNIKDIKKSYFDYMLGSE